MLYVKIQFHFNAMVYPLIMLVFNLACIAGWFSYADMTIKGNKQLIFF